MKEVISTFEESIRRVEYVNYNKIYAFYSENLKSFYKLQGVDGVFAFCNLENSNSVWGSNQNYVALIKEVIKYDNTVYEFDTLKEFAEWLVKEMK